MNTPPPRTPEQIAADSHRRRALYEKLLHDREFREFILEEWLGGLVTERTQALAEATDPVECRVAKDLWVFARALRDHMAVTVENYRAEEQAQAAGKQRREKNTREGLPLDAETE